MQTISTEKFVNFMQTVFTEFGESVIEVEMVPASNPDGTITVNVYVDDVLNAHNIAEQMSLDTFVLSHQIREVCAPRKDNDARDADEWIITLITEL